MIQRIQSLYLLAVVVLTALALRLPLADFSVGADVFTLRAFGIENGAGEIVQSTLYLGIALAAACLLPLATIFLFRRRMLQVRLCFAELILLLGAEAMMGIYFFLADRYFSGGEFYAASLRIALVFPLVGLIFDWLALRAILRDERLVRSLDRIR